MPKEKVFTLPLLFEGNCQWPPLDSSSWTNRLITVYFKRYAYNVYPKILEYLHHSHPLKYVAFCYPLEMNVHGGHNTDSFLKVCRVLRPTNK